MRTHEQVVADVEQRFKELKEEKRKHDEEMAKPKYTKPCHACRHYVAGGEYHSGCSNPLIQGVSKFQLKFYHAKEYPRNHQKDAKKLSVCLGIEEKDRLGIIVKLGAEQALWEPRLKWWQKIIDRVVNINEGV